MFFRTQRRRHFRVRVVTFDGAVGQRKMMRRDFAGHVYAFIFRPPDGFDRAFRRNVRDVNARAVSFARIISRTASISSASAGIPFKPSKQRNFPFVHHAARRQRFVLAMVNDRQIEILRVFHRPPHHSRIRNRSPVVGNRHRARRFHLAHFG
jgi:hypothetical protein